MSFSNFLKGWVGEALGIAAHWLFLDRKIYRPLNNLTLSTKDGTTQIDHVIVSKYGLFVIEAKNIKGWIYGDERSPQWSIVRFRRTFQMQNPLHQNYRHIRAVADSLGLPDNRLHSMVMFWGACEFKTEMPRNVLCKGYTAYIKSFNKVLFTDQEVVSIVEALRLKALPKTWATHRLHLKSLKSRHANTGTSVGTGTAAGNCPKCASPLTLRTAKSDANAGSKFYGCSAYPKCRHTAPF